MGYRAPSAQDVYRYVFRLDKHSRSLTDGFGLSIIFVNDHSPVCHDLIDNYFVDLCHRTADRIRIIFFSELPESYFEKIARRMHSDSYSAKGLCENGFLNQVIEEMPRSDRHYSREILDEFLEALHWRDYKEVDFLLSKISKDFGPRYADALYRLVRQHRDSLDRNIETRIHELISEIPNPEWKTRNDRFRRIYQDHWRDLTPDSMIIVDAPERTRELSFDVKNNTAMPGVGESMRFAASLGIGSHVPCFVFFTDIGELTIDVFPVGNLSAHEAYNQMKNWIDGFYQKNQVSLNKWNQVEQRIISFIESINKPLTNLKYWIDKSENLWSELRLVAETITKLRRQGEEIAACKPLIDNLNTSSSRCDRILSNCGARLKSIYTKHQLEQQHLETVINRLETIYSSTKIYNELLHIVDQPVASQALDVLGIEIQLIKQLKSNLKIVSLENQLFQWWGNIRRKIPSFNKFRKAHKDNASQDTKSKYKDFIKSVFELPFSDTLEILLEKAKLLSDRCGIDSPEYSLQLVPFFVEIHTNAPKWIDGTNLIISDIFPIQSQDRTNFSLILNEIGDDHPINKMIRENTTIEQKKQRELFISEIEAKILQCRSRALTKLINLRDQLLDVSTEEKEAYSVCLCDMYNLRNEIEKELTKLANSSPSPDKSLRLVELNDIQEFIKLLNEYRETVNHLVYPYKQDRRVQKVNLADPFSQIFELELRKHQPNISQTRPRELEIKLEQTIPDSQSGVNLLQDIREMSCTITPKARLANEISKIKPALNILENLEEKLYELNDNELRVVSNSIAKLDTVIVSRDVILDIILAIVGLLPDRELATHRQYANRPINLEVTTVTEQSKSVEVEMIFNAPVTGATGKNDGTININVSDQKKTLADAANEIQQLLTQLEKTNPSATEPEKIAYIDDSVQASLKQRTIAALRTGGETAIDEFFLENKYLKVGKAVVKAWLQPTS